VVLLAKRHRSDWCSPLVRLVLARTDSGLESVLVWMLGSILVVVVLVIGMESL
jgi:hypothetical protein